MEASDSASALAHRFVSSMSLRVRMKEMRRITLGSDPDQIDLIWIADVYEIENDNSL
jgi:hypothetical protein